LISYNHKRERRVRRIEWLMDGGDYKVAFHIIIWELEGNGGFIRKI